MVRTVGVLHVAHALVSRAGPDACVRGSLQDDHLCEASFVVPLAAALTSSVLPRASALQIYGTETSDIPLQSRGAAVANRKNSPPI